MEDATDALMLQVFYGYVSRYNSAEKREEFFKFLDQRTEEWVENRRKEEKAKRKRKYYKYKAYNATGGFAMHGGRGANNADDSDEHSDKDIDLN